MSIDFKETVITFLETTYIPARVISEKTGVPIATINSIRYRYTTNPGVDHIQKLYDFFTQNPQPAVRKAGGT